MNSYPSIKQILLVSAASALIMPAGALTNQRFLQVAAQTGGHHSMLKPQTLAQARDNVDDTDFEAAEEDATHVTSAGTPIPSEDAQLAVAATDNEDGDDDDGDDQAEADEGANEEVITSAQAESNEAANRDDQLKMEDELAAQEASGQQQVAGTPVVSSVAQKAEMGAHPQTNSQEMEEDDESPKQSAGKENTKEEDSDSDSDSDDE